MTIEVPPTRVPRSGSSARLALGVLAVSLALMVGVAVFGADRATNGPARPVPTPSRAAAAVATSTASAVTPSPTPTFATEPPVPEATPLATPRAGIPTVTTGPAVVLSEPATLVSSGIETLSPDPGWYGRVVADGDGLLWGIGGGRVVRYDPGTGTTRTWMVDDDARFVANDFIPARAGGVWLIGTRTLRRFDGSGFHDAVDVEADIVTAVEAPDRSLWVATADGAVVHLVGTRRTRIDALRPNADAFITAFAVDATGRVWCGWVQGGPDPGPGDGWVARYDGAAWRVFDARQAAPLGRVVRTILALPGGSVWVSTDGGLASFDGSRWTDLTARDPRLVNLTSMAGGADGSIWAASADPTDGAVTVGRFGGRSWTWFGPSDGLPDPHEGGSASMIPSPSRVLVGTDVGVYGLSNGRWERVWSMTQPPGPAGTPQPPGPAWASRLIAVSRDEVWAAEGENVWRFAKGRWSGPSVPFSGGPVRDLLRTPDGTLWAALDQGGAYMLQGTAWTPVGTGSASALTMDSNGVVWIAGPGASGPQGSWVVRVFGRDGGTWTEWGPTPSTELIGAPAHLAVGGDGTVWAGGGFGWGPQPGLARYLDGRWEMVLPRGGSSPFVRDLTTAPNGDVWVAGADATPSGEATTDVGASWIARFDGTRWTVFRLGGGPASFALSVAAAADGTIWVATVDGLARFDGVSWTTLYPGIGFSTISVAPDGTVWVLGPSGVERLTSSAMSR